MKFVNRYTEKYIFTRKSVSIMGENGICQMCGIVMKNGECTTGFFCSKCGNRVVNDRCTNHTCPEPKSPPAKFDGAVSHTFLDWMGYSQNHSVDSLRKKILDNCMHVKLSPMTRNRHLNPIRESVKQERSRRIRFILFNKGKAGQYGSGNKANLNNDIDFMLETFEPDYDGYIDRP